jgi:hypothetical protein
VYHFVETPSESPALPQFGAYRSSCLARTGINLSRSDVLVAMVVVVVLLAVGSQWTQATEWIKPMAHKVIASLIVVGIASVMTYVLRNRIRRQNDLHVYDGGIFLRNRDNHSVVAGNDTTAHRLSCEYTLSWRLLKRVRIKETLFKGHPRVLVHVVMASGVRFTLDTRNGPASVAAIRVVLRAAGKL